MKNEGTIFEHPDMPRRNVADLPAEDKELAMSTKDAKFASLIMLVGALTDLQRQIDGVTDQLKVANQIAAERPYPFWYRKKKR